MLLGQLEVGMTVTPALLFENDRHDCTAAKNHWQWLEAPSACFSLRITFMPTLLLVKSGYSWWSPLLGEAKLRCRDEAKLRCRDEA